jgi:GT2 family glycosyltransferase
VGRKDLLARTLAHLERQQRPPDEVVISAPDTTHVAPVHSDRFPVSYAFGKRGLTAQRNLALAHVLARADIVTFFDDDFLPSDNYLEQLVRAFEENPDWAVIHGNVVHDGARGSGFTFAQGLAALRAAETSASGPPHVVDHPGAYGCNMSVRARHVGSLRFDERLVLYGWQEDIDFTSQLGRFGRIVSLSTLLGVHLGAKGGGRASGVRFGYSQLVNPVYLIRKGTMPAGFALELMGRNVAANVVRSLWPEAHIDRRGRLKGNLIAAWHLLRGRIEPEYVLQLPG